MKKIILLSILVIIAILFGHQIKRSALSALVLADVLRPSRPLMQKFIKGPAVRTVAIQGRRGSIRADLYTPLKGKSHFPLLLVHGAGFEGKDNARLILLAKDFARAGFLVLAPELKGLKNYRFRISDAEDVLESFLYLKRRSGGPGGAMLGMQFGSGPVLLAAANPRIRDKISLVVTFGGYYDLRNVLLYGLTGSFEYRGHGGTVKPEESLRWMLAYKNLDALNRPEDRDALRKIIERRNTYDFAGAAALVKELGPRARTVYDFLVNRERGEFALLYEKLPLPLRERVYGLSPARAVDYIKASFMVIHATDDFAVPYTESLRLADAVGYENRVRTVLLPQFLHGEPGDLSLGTVYNNALSGIRLFRLIYDLLEQGGV